MIGLGLAFAAPVHQVCGGIPGGMYDVIERRDRTLTVTMHRYISDDATSQYLEVLFLDGRGAPLGEMWRGRPSTAKYDKPSATWSTRARLRLPDGTEQLVVADTHHGRTCRVQLLSGGQLAVVRVERAGEVAVEVREGPSFVDEALEEATVDVKRGRRATVKKRRVEDAPDNLEERAMRLAQLKQNLPRMELEQVLQWMEFQGFSPEDADVIETLGADWRSRTREPR